MARKKFLNGLKDTDRFCDLESWDDLYGYCAHCIRMGLVDRYELERKYGTRRPINSLTPKLKCVLCKGKTMNKFGTNNRARD